MSKQQSGAIIGQKGVQYGLQVVPKKACLQAASSAQRKVAPANVFGDDDSEEENVELQIARQADKKRAAAKVQQMYEEALAEDPSVFDYDGVYDSIQEARVAPKQQDKMQRQSKYIASLLEQAQQRKREQDVLYERRMVKERQQEDHLYEDKERFVTSAYRKKLEEDKKWQEAERQKELEEQRNDVRKVGHMGNFYANLLTKNVAYGAAKPQEDITKDKEPVATSASECNSFARPSRAGTKGSSASPPPESGGGSDAAVKGATTTGPSAKVLAQLDRYDMLRLEAEKVLRERKLVQEHHGQQEQRHEEQKGKREEDPDPESAPRRGEQDARSACEPPEVRRSRQDAKETLGQGCDDIRPSSSGNGIETPDESKGLVAADEVVGAAGFPKMAGEAPGPGGKRRNDDMAVQSARERYLARKQQKTS
ncbi:hypothetical protein Vretimale_18292 [Volvox reticuliferus]|uniref:Nuclear speckle splicing regulatory protein 1 N-terminal domain-containing protein n=2 Tax=Volvox reticuliferus TaxID=1737510 RepID=A0A8J4GYC1_9CHLO|nr:hypothetical protein Vretimale_18292 [Volvox reticuliferus]